MVRVRSGSTCAGAATPALMVGAAAFFLVPRNPLNPLLRPAGEVPERAEFAKAVSLNHVVSVERAVRIYYDSTGRYPRSLEDLIVAPDGHCPERSGPAVMERKAEEEIVNRGHLPVDTLDKRGLE